MAFDRLSCSCFRRDSNDEEGTTDAYPALGMVLRELYNPAQLDVVRRIEQLFDYSHRRDTT